MEKEKDERVTLDEFIKELGKKEVWYKELYYRLLRIKYLLIEYPIGRIKFFMQRLFRKNHTADVEIWNLNSYLAEYLLRKLKAFKEAPRQGFPCYFLEYDKSYFDSREEYDKQVKEGNLVPGGPEKWEELIDEMIFAFDFITVEMGYDDKKRKEFCKRHNLEDWITESSYSYNEKFEEYYERAEKGLILFGKHFMSLWD